MSIVLALILTSTMVVWGKTTTTKTAKNDPFGKYDQTVMFTLGRQGVSGNNLPKGDTLDNNQYLKYVENNLNIKINIAFSVDDSEGYKQKVNLTMASGSMPDVLEVTDDSQLKRLVESGSVEDLTNVYNNYASPLIKKYYDSYKGRTLDAATFNGKLMAIPDTVIQGNHQLLWVRQDWMDKLKLKAPKTVDDVINIAKAFVKNKPDGKDDTVGLLGTADPFMYGDGAFFSFDPIFNAFGSYPAAWIKDKAGKVVYGSTTPETKTAIAKLRDMYAAGVIDKQFATRKWDDNAALVSSGKAGILFAPWYAGWMLSDSVKNNSKADWKAYTVPLGSNGKRNVAGSKPTSAYLVVRKGYAHPDAVIKALNVEYQGLRLLDPKAENLYKGLGVSWLNWPFPIQLNTSTAVADEYQQFKKALTTGNRNLVDKGVQPTYDSIANNIKNPKNSIPDYANYLAFYVGGSEEGSKNLNFINPVFFGQTPSMALRSPNLNKLENQDFLSIVMGDQPISSFDKFVSDWKSQGGNTITNEVIKEVLKK